MEAQLRFLYRPDIMPGVISQFQEKVKAVTEGRLPHAENVLNALVLKLSSLLIDTTSAAPNDVVAPSATARPPTPPVRPFGGAFNFGGTSTLSAPPATPVAPSSTLPGRRTGRR